MDFRVEFTLAPEEIRTAMRAISGPNMRRGAVRLWALLGAIMFVVVALSALSVSVPSDLLEPCIYVFAVWIVVLPVVLALVPKLVGREIAPAFLEPTEFRGNSESFSITRPTFGGSGSWEHFSAWCELPGFFVLAHSPSVRFLVPKRALSSDQVNEIRKILDQVIPHRSG